MKKVLIFAVIILLLVGGCVIGGSVLIKRGLPEVFESVKGQILNGVEKPAQPAAITSDKRPVTQAPARVVNPQDTIELPENFSLLSCQKENTGTIRCTVKEQTTPVKMTYQELASQLYMASEAGATQIVQSLLQQQVPPDMYRESSTGKTALLMAAGSRQYEVAELLLRSGANADVVDSYGRSPAFTAVNNGDTQMLLLLCQVGANLNIRDKAGYSPLFRAVATSQPEVASLLLENGADVNLTANKGVTPLMMAAYKGDVEMVKLLLQAQADTTLVDANGDTALSLAQKRYQQNQSPQRQQIVALLTPTVNQ